MARNRLGGVPRAGRLESALRPQPRRHGHLVPANPREQEPRPEARSGDVNLPRTRGAHPRRPPSAAAGVSGRTPRCPLRCSARPRNADSTSAPNWAYEASAAAGCAVTTRSQPPPAVLRPATRIPRCCRSSSRNRRRTRFRTTAPPTRLLTAYPTRVRPMSFGRPAMASNARRSRRPARRVAPNWPRVRKLSGFAIGPAGTSSRAPGRVLGVPVPSCVSGVLGLLGRVDGPSTLTGPPRRLRAHALAAKPAVRSRSVLQWSPDLRSFGGR